MKLKTVKLTFVIFYMVFSSHLFANGESMSSANTVFEILTWKSKAGVSDDEMINAVDSMVGDLKNLNGFLNQTLYKDSDGTWIDIYYWKTEKDAHDSNEGMADKASFKELMSVIEPDTVTMKVVSPKQASGEIQFK
ncbi:MAG: hypothetical protein V3W04_15165 [Gammaproteobacteria bacterium]